MLRFGNIVLMPQSISGEGEDTDKVVHGVKMAPPHPYIATYLWIRHKFDADALIHFGTHGSLEFTPWKQVALSSYDWPDVLIGEMPHYYLYMMNDMGEAQIAKRRSYAALISHLTAPFMYADGYGTIRELDRKIEMRALVEDARLKEEYGKSIIELAKRRSSTTNSSSARISPPANSIKPILNFCTITCTIFRAKKSTADSTCSDAPTRTPKRRKPQNS